MRSIHRKLLAAIAVWTLGVQSALACCSPEGVEEFVGPFANWVIANTGHLSSGGAFCGSGATGNGSTDDHTTIQTCIGDLTTTNPVMFFPAPSSCYKITTGLTFNATSFFSLVGADPATTPICAGTSAMTMLTLNGSNYGTVTRFTFNGESLATTIVKQSWDGTTGQAPTEMLYQDDVFESAANGIVLSTLTNAADSETMIIRDKFSGLTTAGISMGEFNALDEFVWYSNFVSNFDGIQNTLGGGGFHVFNSNFSGDTDADASIGNTGGFNFRNDYSTGSAAFFISTNSGAACNVNLQDDIIVDPTGASAVVLDCLGPSTIVDTTIRSLNGSAGPSIIANSGASGFDRVFTIGNTFTPTTNGPVTTNSGEWVSLLDTVVPRSFVNPSAPTLPTTPANNSRTITEVTPGSSSTTIQTDITNACTGGTTRPVVHIQAATYTSISLTIPSNCDIQLIGDGFLSDLVGTGTGPTLTLSGPNYATIKNLQINGNSNIAITMSGIDQVGARIFSDGLYVNGNVQNVADNGLANATVEMHDFFEAGATGSNAVAIAGPSGANASTFEIFAGASSQETNDFVVTNGGNFVMKDDWFDNGAGGNTRLSVTGAGGAVTLYGGESFEAPPAGISNVLFHDYTGVAAIIGGQYGGGPLTFSGNGVNSLALANILTAGSPINYAAGGYFGLFHNMNNFVNGTFIEFADTANYPNQSYLLSALSQGRTDQPTVPGSPLLPSGASDVRMYRLEVFGGSVGLSINP